MSWTSSSAEKDHKLLDLTGLVAFLIDMCFLPFFFWLNKMLSLKKLIQDLLHYWLQCYVTSTYLYPFSFLVS
jgi:hypothetical protein